MDLNKFKNSIDRIIYDPVQGRISYDFISSALSSFAIFVIFSLFDEKNLNVVFLLLFPTTFLISNFLFGLYGKNKTSILNKKMLIILCSNIISYILLSIISGEYFLFTLLFLVSSILTILPRFFLNFNIERTTFNKIFPYSQNGPILIVGGGGYIGSVLVEELLKKGEKVRVFDKFIYGKNIFKGIRNSKNLELIEGDISDVYSLTVAVKNSSAIVHLAGIVGDPAAKIDEKLTRHVNIASTRLLKETAKAFGIKKFIFASSCSVYGFTKKLQNEKSKPRPISLYAKTKIDSEKELLTDTSDTFFPVVLRFATVFGHSRKPRFDLVANLFTAEAFINKKITVHGGDQWRPFINVRDIAKAIILILDAPEEKVGRKIYNIGDDNLNFTINSLAEIVKKASGNDKIDINFISNKKDKRDYKVSFKKINQELGFSASVTLEKGIKEMYRNFQNKRYKKDYQNSFYVNSEITKELRKEFRSKKYKKSHFSTIS